jgi:integrase
MKKTLNAISFKPPPPGAPDLISIVIDLLITYNCRVSEVLGARWRDFYPGQYLILHAVKGSNHIVVRDRSILSSIKSLHHIDDDFIFAPLTYYIVYHHIKKNYSHLFHQIKSRKNMAITHYFRYANVSKLTQGSDATAVLHHRSKKSAKYYNRKLTDD